MSRFTKFALLTLAAFFALGFSITANAAPPTPDVNVVNTPDVIVANTVDTRVVNTIAAGDLTEGIDFVGGVSGAGGTLQLLFADAVNVRAISTSLAPDVPGESCSVTVDVLDSAAAPDDWKDIGLSLMSNGQASTVSRNYEIPLEDVYRLRWSFYGGPGICNIVVSVAAEPFDDSGAAEAFRSEPAARIEIR